MTLTVFFAQFSGATGTPVPNRNCDDLNVISESAFLPNISEEELRILIGSFNHRQSPGIDGIRIFDLHRNFELIKTVLLELLNAILESGNIPSELKTAVVRPLHKSGDRTAIQNYRPISILSCFSKIIEKHIFMTMKSFLHRHGCLAECQYGFVEDKGTQVLLEDLGDVLYESFDKNMISCALFLDVAKAFDTVSHDILLDKLYKYGFRGPFHKILQSFLSDRSQLVSVGKIRSCHVHLKAGVPQGSILSPLLFNLYVNDMHNVLSNCKLFQYADDTALIATHINLAGAMNILQDDTMKIFDWFNSNLLKINPEKSKLVCFRNTLKNISLTPELYLHGSQCTNCSCTPALFSDSVKYLGIWFDSGLLWNTHLSNVCVKLRRTACLLYQIKSLVPLFVKKMLVNSFAYSILRYGITVFVHCSSLWHRRVDRLLQCMLKSVASSFDELPSANIFQFVRMPNLYTLFVQTVILKHFWDDKYKDIKVSPRNLRQSPSFCIPKSRTKFGTCLRSFYVPTIFNDISSDTKACQSIQSLRKSLGALYLEKPP